ncbi:MAG: division/cell wall cluster transcriptional repressor MraZ [Acidiferrobacterales bacterium]|nr:division/cell wall cluster transcriptional repressor MraZ [Acidiferrobacterales bacterium]
MARGSNYINLDAKGRMSIPTKHRAALVGESEGRLVVTISPTDKCLLLYRLEDWNVVEQKLIALPTLNSQTRTLKRMLIGNADDCAMDGSGRILLSQQLREFASIDKKVVLVGQGDKYEIWDEAHWVAQRDSMLIEELDESALSAELEALSF